MSATAVILLLIAACTHAAWNLLTKRQHPTAALFLAASAMGAVCFSPLLIYHADLLRRLPAAVWLFLLATGCFQGCYYAALAGAYRAGDMSLAYPLARSSPIIVIAAVTFLLGKGHEVSGQCLAGIFLVVAGCFVLPMQRFGELRLKNYLNRCCLLAFLAAFGTAGYTLVDDEALRCLRQLPGAPGNGTELAMIYCGLEAASAALWLSLYTLLHPVERANLRQLLVSNKRKIFLISVGIYGTYLLVLISMDHVDNVSYVAAFRQLSIPLGSVLGVLLLKEPSHPPKFAGIAILVAGLILVGTG